MKKIMVLVFCIGFLVSGLAYADGFDMTHKSVAELATFSGAPATGDKMVIYDASADAFKAMTATAGAYSGVVNGTVGATTPAAGVFTTLQANTSLKVNATDGTALTAIRVASDTVASGQTAKTVTVTGATAASKCVATGNEIPTNTAYIKSAAPGTDQVVVTVNTDPGASNLDITVLCLN